MIYSQDIDYIQTYVFPWPIQYTINFTSLAYITFDKRRLYFVCSFLIDLIILLLIIDLFYDQSLAYLKHTISVTNLNSPELPQNKLEFTFHNIQFIYDLPCIFI